METTEKALKQLLRTDKPLMSEEFWQSSDSSSIYYMDGDESYTDIIKKLGINQLNK